MNGGKPSGLYLRGSLRVVVPPFRGLRETKVVEVIDYHNLPSALREAGQRGRVEIYDGEGWIKAEEYPGLRSRITCL